MKLQASTIVAASPEEIAHYLLSPEYVRDLKPRLEAVTQIEEVALERTERQVERVLRFEAPTQLPGFLKTYEGRAPKTVAWNERTTWEVGTKTMSFVIEAEAPEHWKQWYTNKGTISIDPRPKNKSQGNTEVSFLLDFKIKVFGLGRVIEKALGPEVQLVLEAQVDAVQAHFKG